MPYTETPRAKRPNWRPPAIPQHTIHGWAVRQALLEDAARVCRAPLALVLNPGTVPPNREPETFRARRIVALTLRMFGVSLPSIGQMLDRDHASIRNAVLAAEANTWERQAAEQLAAKYAPRAVAS